MEQANRGILKIASRDDSHPLIGPSRLIVLVRPFDFSQSVHDSYPHGTYIPGVLEGEEYLDALETTLYTDYGAGDIFIFGHNDQIDSTRDGLEDIGALEGSHNVYFVPISPGEGSLEGRSLANFSKVSRFLRNLSSQRVGFAGGPIMHKGRLRKKYSGCLGEVFTGLRKEGVRGSLLRGACFTPKLGPA